MRPRGSIRQALQEHLQAAEQGATWHDLALRLEAAGLINTAAPGEMRLVRRAVENMVKAGEAERLPGTARRAWARRPLRLYGARAVVVGSTDAADQGAALAMAWGAFAGDL
jgi:hypothetical protein